MQNIFHLLIVVCILSASVQSAVKISPAKELAKLPKTFHKSLKQAVAELYAMQDPTVAERVLTQSFKTTEGGYAADDRFLGVYALPIRRLASSVIAVNRFTVDDALAVLDSPYNEQRYFSLLLLVNRFRRAAWVIRKYRSFPEHPEVVEAKRYRENIAHELLQRIPTQVTNYNLVDVSVPPILGQYFVEEAARRPLLHKLAESSNIWERRSALMATLPLIKKSNFKDFEPIAEQLMYDEQKLIRTATAWLLRAAGDKDRNFLMQFMDKHVECMYLPVIRKAVEWLPPQDANKYIAIRQEVKSRKGEKKKRPIILRHREI